MILQQPDWVNKKQLQTILEQIRNYPKLVSKDEIDVLKNHLSDVSQGRGFIIQGGDCAETFSDFSAKTIKNKLNVRIVSYRVLVMFMNQQWKTCNE